MINVAFKTPLKTRLGLQNTSEPIR